MGQKFCLKPESTVRFVQKRMKIFQKTYNLCNACYGQTERNLLKGDF